MTSGVTDKIVRIGSRSKSDTLEPYNLLALVESKKAFVRTPVERFEESKQYKRLEDVAQAGEYICDALAHGPSRMHFHQISDLLRRDFPEHYDQLSCEQDEDGFRIPAGKNGNYFHYWLQGKDLGNRNHVNQSAASQGKLSRSLAESLGENIWDLSRSERIRLAEYWARLLREDWIDRALVQAENFTDAELKLNTLKSEYKARTLENVDVIGLTTTGLARNTSLLQRIGSKTLICEEAGEVLEVITAK